MEEPASTLGDICCGDGASVGGTVLILEANKFMDTRASVIASCLI